MKKYIPIPQQMSLDNLPPYLREIAEMTEQFIAMDPTDQSMIDAAADNILGLQKRGKLDAGQAYDIVEYCGSRVGDEEGDRVKQEIRSAMERKMKE